MTTHIEATFSNGVLVPIGPLPLADQTRVRLAITPVDAWSPEQGRAAWESLKARLAEHPLHLGGKRFTRDELYERR